MSAKSLKNRLLAGALSLSMMVSVFSSITIVSEIKGRADESGKRAQQRNENRVG